MKSRSRRGNRQAAMKARLGIATAVLVGGGAIGVAAVAAANHGTAATTAQSAGFTLNFHHTISEQQALSSALSTWGQSQQKSMTTLAEMAPMRTFNQFWSHRTEFAAQRGVVVLATKKFLLVKSADRQLHLWWLNGATKVRNVGASATGMAAMTGNDAAATAAMKTNNMAPAAVTMAGSTSAVSQMAAPVSKPTTITVDTGNQVITITITSGDRHGDAADHHHRDDDARRDGDADRDLDLDLDGHRDGDTHGDRDGDRHADHDRDQAADHDGDRGRGPG